MAKKAADTSTEITINFYAKLHISKYAAVFKNNNSNQELFLGSAMN